MTTKEVATRAGVSEGSVFYHFADRTGLLVAVIEDGLAPLMAIKGGKLLGNDPTEVMTIFAAAVEKFLDQALVALIAAQSDAELRTKVAEFLAINDFGPHRGVEMLGSYLATAQDDGIIRADVDTRAVALMLVSTTFMRASTHQMISATYGSELPDGKSVVETLTALLQKPQNRRST